MIIPPDMRVTITDVRAAGHCVNGVREWFQMNGLDFRDFMRHGISATTFVEQGDALSAAVVRGMLE